MSLVEVVIAAAIVALVFGGLAQGFRLMVELVSDAKAKAGALALASERMEYLRSLPYHDVGTDGGIPAGTIPQNATTTLNGITYAERLLVEYVDAPEDGIGAADTNDILADYKRVKVVYRWDRKGSSKEVSLISNIVPPGVESTAGGGTLTVNVFDAGAAPVAGTEVSIYNDTGTTTIDLMKYTNDEGVAMFSGAPALANYQITATKSGYSTAGTYSAGPENPNPDPAHVAVLESEVSTMYFQIDAESVLTVRTVGTPTSETFSDTFESGTYLAAFDDTALGSGAVVLAPGGGGYASSGSVKSTVVTPPIIASWDTLSFTADTPEDTGATIQLFTLNGTSTYTLVPDAFVAGNSTGFATGTIALTGIPAVTYPALVIGATLETSDASTTPALLEWTLAYTIDEPPIGSVPLTLTSDKTIGTMSDDSPIPKYAASHTTDGGGEVTIDPMEWGLYTIALATGSYDIVRACDPLPYTLAPDTDETLTLTLVPNTGASLRVTVTDTLGAPLTGATATLTRGGLYDEVDTTGTCGQAFFADGLVAASDYSLTVSAPGYEHETIGVEIETGEDATVTVILTGS